MPIYNADFIASLNYELNLIKIWSFNALFLMANTYKYFVFQNYCWNNNNNNRKSEFNKELICNSSTDDSIKHINND